MNLKNTYRSVRRVIRFALLMDSNGLKEKSRVIHTLIANYVVTRRIQTTLLMLFTIVAMEAILLFDCTIDVNVLFMAFIAFSIVVLVLVLKVSHECRPLELYARLSDQQRDKIAKYRKISTGAFILELFYLAARFIYELSKLSWSN